MAGCSRGSLPAWMSAAASRVDLSSGAASGAPSPSSHAPSTGTDQELGMAERALSAAGAAFVSAIIVNPLDIAKTRLQAQAAGVLYNHPPQMAALRPEAERVTFVAEIPFPIFPLEIFPFLQKITIFWVTEVTIFSPPPSFSSSCTQEVTISITSKISCSTSTHIFTS